MRKLTTEEFVEKAVLVHNNKYSYSKTQYIRSNQKVIITCPAHGDFYQTPNNHLTFGCGLCGVVRTTAAKSKTREQFIAEASLVHNNLYNYEELTYTNWNAKVKIRCLVHGIFSQRAGDHLKGKGCPSCRNSKGELKIEKLLKELNITFERQKQFSDCLNPDTGRILRFDFYLPFQNTVIEFDGQQHFEPCRINGMSWDQAYAKHKSLVKLDTIKNEYCKTREIKMVRISYTDVSRVAQFILGLDDIRDAVPFVINSENLL